MKVLKLALVLAVGLVPLTPPVTAQTQVEIDKATKALTIEIANLEEWVATCEVQAANFNLDLKALQSDIAGNPSINTPQIQAKLTKLQGEVTSWNACAAVYRKKVADAKKMLDNLKKMQGATTKAPAKDPHHDQELLRIIAKLNEIEARTRELDRQKAVAQSELSKLLQRK